MSAFCAGRALDLENLEYSFQLCEATRGKFYVAKFLENFVDILMKVGLPQGFVAI